ncbi:hypothetical protein P4S72_16090 [Vibrio sp. PP-XX7]
MVFLDRIDTKTTGAAIAGQDDLTVNGLPDKTRSPFSVTQPAVLGAEITESLCHHQVGASIGLDSCRVAAA